MAKKSKRKTPCKNSRLGWNANSSKLIIECSKLVKSNILLRNIDSVINIPSPNVNDDESTLAGYYDFLKHQTECEVLKRFKFLKYDPETFFICSKCDDEDEKSWKIDEENLKKLIEDINNQSKQNPNRINIQTPNNITGSSIKIPKQDKDKKILESSLNLDALKRFIRANKTRGLTRVEVMEFCGVTYYSKIRNALKDLPDGEKYLASIIDLRSSEAPKDAPIIPNSLRKRMGLDKSPVESIVSDTNTDIETKEVDVEEKAEVPEIVETAEIEEKAEVPEMVGTAEFEEKVEVSDIVEAVESEEKVEVSDTVEAVKLEEKIETSDSAQTTQVEEKVRTIDVVDEPKTIVSTENSDKNSTQFSLSNPNIRVLKKATTNSNSHKKLPVKNTKNRINLSRIIAAESYKVVNYIFDTKLFNLSMHIFEKILSDIITAKIKPVIWVFENQLMLLDNMKEKNPVAQDMLKYFASDDPFFKTEFLEGEIPNGEELAKLCKDNDLMLVSENALNIAWCKIYNAKFLIPRYFLEKNPSPFVGNEVIGVDSCVLGNRYLESIFRKIRTIWISDIQLRERNFSNSEFCKILAYYGKFGIAEKKYEINDRNIVNFYKEKGVDKVYTADYGFKVFAKFANLKTEIVYIDSMMTSCAKPKIIEKFEERNRKCKPENLTIVIGDIIKIDTMCKTVDRERYVLKEMNGVHIQVYDSYNRPKTSCNNIVKIKENDVLVIENIINTLLIQIISTDDCSGKVLFYGDKERLPKYFKLLG